MSVRLTDAKTNLVEALAKNFGNVVNRKQVLDYVKSVGLDIKAVRWLLNNKAFRAGRGQYDLSTLLADDTAKTDAKDERPAA
jgi:hypothetical protein